MKSDDAIREATAATLQFERELESLVLAAFADGARIEGTWTIEVPVATAPDWTVEVRKHRAEGDGGETDDRGTNCSGDDGETNCAGGDNSAPNGGKYVPEFVEE